MNNCHQESPIVNNIFFIFLQVILIFVFLCIFFFSYVINSEKKSFKSQINLIVDDLQPDFDVRSLVPLGKENLSTAVLYGTLDNIRKKSMKNFESEESQINKQNDAIKNKAYLLAGISILFLLIVIIILIMLGYCIPFHIHLKYSIIAVFFVALTELIFLNIFTSKYWSIDPIEVRHRLGNTIQNWIQQHHPVDI